MTNLPYFSIVIPVYNVAPYLRECLDSVLAQTFADWEAICIDDGSTDGSDAILDEYAAKDRRINVLHTGNRGVSAARNLGIDRASGEYVTFLDGDDAYERYWLETFNRLIKETGADLVRLGVRLWDGGAHEIASSDDCADRVCFDGDEVARWGCQTYSLEGWSWLNAIRRSCLNDVERVRFPDGMKFMEDIIFMLKVLPHVRKACQGKVAGYLYRRRATSVCGGVKNMHMVVRVFGEVSRLYASMSQENRKCVSWLLGRTVLHWRERWDRNEVDGEVIVRGCVANAIQDSFFKMSDLPARWRPGFAALLSLHSFLVIDLLLCLQKAWGWARLLPGRVCGAVRKMV